MATVTQVAKRYAFVMGLSLPMILAVAPASGTLVGTIQGAGATDGGLSFTISGLLLPNGAATGFASYCAGFDEPQQTCADGPVIQVVPPQPSQDYWCVTSQVASPDGIRPDPLEPDYHAVLLYRGEPGGVQELDIKLGPGTGVSCDALPSPPALRPFATGAIVTFPEW